MELTGILHALIKINTHPDCACGLHFGEKVQVENRESDHTKPATTSCIGQTP